MKDNLIIENLTFTEELYKKALEENIFNYDDIHGIGDETNGNS